MLWGVLVTAFSLPGLIAPRVMWQIFASWQFRNVEAMTPSNRRFRVARAGSATTLLIGIVLIVAGVWPGSADEKATAALTTAVIGIPVFVAGVVISIVIRKRRIARGTHSGEESPPNEPTDIVYGFEYFSIAFYLVALVVIAGTFVGAEQRSADRLDEWREDHDGVLDDDQQEIVDDNLKLFSTLYVTPLPVLDAVPEGALLATPTTWALIDIDARLPQDAWDQSEISGGGTADTALSAADVVVTFNGFSCTPTAFVVQETDTTVALAAVVDVVDGVPAAQEGTNLAECSRGNGVMSSHFAIDLTAPIGDRDVTTPAGGRILQSRD